MTNDFTKKNEDLFFSFEENEDIFFFCDTRSIYDPARHTRTLLFEIVYDIFTKRVLATINKHFFIPHMIGFFCFFFYSVLSHDYTNWLLFCKVTYVYQVECARGAAALNFIMMD